MADRGNRRMGGGPKVQTPKAGVEKTGTGSRGREALLIIDVINDLEFPGGEKVLAWAERLATRLRAFRRRAHAVGIPVIYVNDNFGHWQSNFSEVYKFCTRNGARGREVSRRLRPTEKDYFILKPRHSAFFATSLIPLLEDLGVERLVLTGMATNLCVLFSAHDAHMHGYRMTVLSDCCAAESDFDHDVALSQLERFCKARVCLSSEFVFRDGGRKHEATKPRRTTK